MSTITTFQDLFAEDKQHLDNALAANVLEQNHLRRCMDLAHMIQWSGGDGFTPNKQNGGNPLHKEQHGNGDNEFGRLLGVDGVSSFNQVLNRIVSYARNSANPQLSEPQKFLTYALYIHDLGKYDETLDRFNGADHEERSAQIAIRQQNNLISQLGWQAESVDLLVGLARFHAILGIVHLGGASMLYLTPLLEWIIGFGENEQRLFLDLLIILNCCDAGASGNFATQQFYLNRARLLTYIRAADEIMRASRNLQQEKHTDPQAALLEQATQLPNVVERIQRIVSSNNALSVAPCVAKNALQNVISRGYFNPTSFALTRFDHGTYVFEPLLHRLLQESASVTEEALTKLLLLIGLLCRDIHTSTVIPLRDIYSMKADLQPQNQRRFDTLVNAVATGQPEAICAQLS